MGIDWRLFRIHSPQLSAQGFDMGIDGTVEAFPGIDPHQLHQLLTGEDATGRVKQGFQQQKFVARQIQRLAEPADRRRLLIEHKLADAYHGDGAANFCSRRSTVRTRAQTSRGENGLAM